MEPHIEMGLEQILLFMQAHGSSIELNYGEDNGCWECSWITGGDRFTGVSTQALIAAQQAMNKVRAAYPHSEIWLEGWGNLPWPPPLMGPMDRGIPAP
jgi:hypothetical protein